MRAAAVPFALATVLTFWSPIGSESWLNAGFLFLMLKAAQVVVLTRLCHNKQIACYAFVSDVKRHILNFIPDTSKLTVIVQKDLSVYGFSQC